jgi:DNA-binding NarL/FixJ family response regulator
MRILIADDHELFAELLRLALERSLAGDGNGPVEVVAVKSFEAAHAAVAACGHDNRKSFDLIMLDMKMPGMNGVSGLRRMRGQAGHIPIAIVSGMLTPAEARAVMQEGANGFIPKALPLDEVIGAIRSVLGGERFVPTRFLMVGADDASIVSRHEGASLSLLTPREQDILREVVQGWTNKQIGQNLGIGEVTVKTHMMSLFRKIGAKNRADAVRIGLGLLAAADKPD